MEINNSAEEETYLFTAKVLLDDEMKYNHSYTEIKALKMEALFATRRP